jgi:hypothetical protein
MTEIRITNGDEAISQLGEPKFALRSGATIRKREPNSQVEILETSWGPQEAHRGVDYVAIQDDGSEYPYKIVEWNANMAPVEGDPERFFKKVPSKLIAVPEGVLVKCGTIDAGEQDDLEIRSPDFLCIGGANEVYPLSRERFDNEFEWVN